MLVGVISDTHDNMHMLKKAVDLFNERAVERVLAERAARPAPRRKEQCRLEGEEP